MLKYLRRILQMRGSAGLYTGGGGGTWVFFGWICAARDSKLAPLLKNISPKIDTPF